ncbi:LiaF transmembrane domain-containing protein [Paucilactobacillus hokkaidonensis]|uniref:LiaF transmembrane domain-containing protein n=1 Tax=Paucilactobacillus hokkaidonensis TaxID=1193095 RepID=UPI000A4E5A7D
MVLGHFFVLGAGILITSKMGWFSYQISTFSTIATIFLAAILIQSIVYLSIFGTVFSLAFLSMLYAGPLKITPLVPWTILAAALLLSIGLTLILHPRRMHHRWHQNARMKQRQQQHWQYNHQTTTTTDTDDQSYVDIQVSMSSNIRYLQSSDFKQANIYAYMANAKVYFDNVTIQDAKATINIDGSLSGIELYIPREWNLNIQTGSFLSGTEEKGSTSTKEGPIVELRGQLHLSGLTVIRV